MSTTNPTIEVFAICYNEEKIMPFFLNYYSGFCSKITIFDNYSTDGTIEIIKKFAETFPIDLIMYDTNNTLNDSVYLEIKNNCWKKSEADYVIVVDSDEFIYHENIKKFLLDNPKPIYKPKGYDMVSDTFPKGTDILQIKTGRYSCNYSKLALFSPKHVQEINYNLGCHTANPTLIGYCNEVLEEQELKLLHYKNLSFDYRINKHQEYVKRFSDFNKNTGSGIHYFFDENQQREEFLNLKNDAINIVYA
jgi:glycosyltransferase involved in cell wall biosynthesis